MTIRLQKRDYDLPNPLMACPQCGRGDLTWDGRRAWRCTSSYTWTTSLGVVRRCHYGLALAYLFDDHDLELQLAAGKALVKLQLSDAAVEDLYARVFTVSWLTREEIETLHARLSLEEWEREQLREVEDLMKEPAGHPHACWGDDDGAD